MEMDARPEAYLPKNVLPWCLLLLLAEEEGYGYELHSRLSDLLPGRWDAGTLYRSLNTLEDRGLVGSRWEASGEGPARRRYAVTERGHTALAGWVQAVAGVNAVLLGIIKRYECGVQPAGHRQAGIGSDHDEAFWVRRILSLGEQSPV